MSLITQEQLTAALAKAGLTEEVFNTLPAAAQEAIKAMAAAMPRARAPRTLTAEEAAELEKRQAERAAFVKYEANNKGLVLELQNMGGETVARVLGRMAKRIPYQQAAEVVASLLLSLSPEAPEVLAKELAEVKPRKRKGEGEETADNGADNPEA